MTNPKTNIAGILLAGFTALAIYQQNGGNLADWKQWVIPACVAMLAFYSKDHDQPKP